MLEEKADTRQAQKKSRQPLHKGEEEKNKN